MSRSSRRDPPPRRPVVRKRAVTKASLGDRLLARLPVSQEGLRRAATWSIMGAVGLAIGAAAIWAGAPRIAGEAVAESVGRAGFRVDQIEITGLRRMDRMSVYAIALDQQSRAMPLVDLAGVRDKLLRYGWIAEAHVSRRYPDTLLVHIVEREPAAIWQDQGQLTLIDKDGVLLEPVDPQKMPDLPLMIGPGADRQEAGYQALMAAAPALRRHVKAAAWIGNRRWDLTFDTGETLALPQEGAARALVRFAELAGNRRLLGRGWLRFDMRDPTRLVARKPGPGRGPGGADAPAAGQGAGGGDERALDAQTIETGPANGASTRPIRVETASAETA